MRCSSSRPSSPSGFPIPSGCQFDLVWLVAPDSYAAMNAATSGAFVLSESYLYTQEMIATALEHLTEGGILCAQFGEVDFEQTPNRTLRYLGTGRAAYEARGVNDFARHVLVGTFPGWKRLQASTVLLKKTPFTAEEVDRFVTNIGALQVRPSSSPGPTRRATRPSPRS